MPRLAAIALLFASNAWAAELQVTQKSSIVLVAPTDRALSSRRLQGEGAQAWRLSTLASFGEAFQLEAAYALRPSAASEEFPDTPEDRSYRLADLASTLGNSSRGARVEQNLDRLQVMVKLPALDLMVGRQAISLGVAKSLEVMDVISAFPTTALDTEHKLGVDALRARIPMSDLDEIDLAVAGHRRDGEPVLGLALARMRWQSFGLHVTTTALRFRTHGLAGLSVESTLGGAGVWAESAYVLAGLFESRKRRDDYARFTAGTDYTLTDGTFLLGEYGFNGAGTNRASELVHRPTHTAYREGRVHLLGRHHLSLAASRNVLPQLATRLGIVANLVDGSLLGSPSAAWEAHDSWSFQGGVHLPVGRRASRATGLRSEFGSRPFLCYMTTRVDF